jgi:triosephosphate isomerase (TIM)
MNIRKLSDLKEKDLDGKRVLVRMDFDVPEDDYTRIEASLPTLNYLLENGSKLLLIGHKGRPDGVRSDKLSLITLIDPLKKFLNEEIYFVPDLENINLEKDGKIFLFENLRFYPGEEENSKEFARNLAASADLYVNEAFATSHRAHASFVALPNLLPCFAGFRLTEEIAHLGEVLETPVRPLIFLISGIKEDKLEMIKKIKGFSDKILIAGRLPEYIEKNENYKDLDGDPKLIIAKLNPDRQDITIHSIERFEEEIKNAKTIVLAGVMGKYEDPGQTLGTERVFKAVAGSVANKIAGGGDTEAALTTFKLKDKFNWISVGGGAMLTFLAGEKLPGIEALKT